MERSEVYCYGLPRTMILVQAYPVGSITDCTRLELQGMSAARIDHTVGVFLDTGMCRQASAEGLVALAKAAQALLAMVGWDPRLDGRTSLAYYPVKDFGYLNYELLQILLMWLRRHLRS